MKNFNFFILVLLLILGQISASNYLDGGDREKYESPVEFFDSTGNARTELAYEGRRISFSEVGFKIRSLRIRVACEVEVFCGYDYTGRSQRFFVESNSDMNLPIIASSITLDCYF